MKGQASVEVMVAISFLGLLLVFSYIVYYERNRDLEWANEFLGAKRSCYELSSAINRARADGRGFQERIRYDGNYEVIIDGDNRYINLKFDDNSVFCTFPTINVTNQTDSSFSLKRGEYFVKNDGESVVFEEV